MDERSKERKNEGRDRENEKKERTRGRERRKKGRKNERNGGKKHVNVSVPFLVKSNYCLFSFSRNSYLFPFKLNLLQAW